MNSLKILAIAFAVFAMFFAINSVSAYIPLQPGIGLGVNPCLFIPCTTNKPVLDVTVDQSDYYIGENDNVTIKFTIKNTGDVAGSVNIQFDESDQDYTDYITADHKSREITVEPNSTETLSFKLYSHNVSSDDYYNIQFDVVKFYRDSNDNVTDLGSETKTITLSVDNYDDFDVSLDNDVICYGADYPVVRNLIFTNDSSHRYYIKPKVKANDDLWPSVKSDTITVQSDSSENVQILFGKQAPVGEYDLILDQELYENHIYDTSNLKHFKKTLTVSVENCEITQNSFYITQQTTTMKNNDKLSLAFDFYNNSDNSMIVTFSGSTDDQSVAVGIPNSTVAVGSQARFSGTFNVLTSDSTSNGIKTITLTATTPYATFTKSITINVTRNNLYVDASSIDIPVGLKGIQTINIQNNTSSEVTADLSIVPVNNNDPIILSDKEITIGSGSIKTVYAEIYPKTIGNKSYKLITTINGKDSEKIIYYTSNSEVGNASFVNTYPSKLTSVSGQSTNLPIVLENIYGFKAKVTLKLMGDTAITSKPVSVILDPNQKRIVNLQYTVNSDTPRTIKAALEVASDVSTTYYTIYLAVTPDTTLANALVLIDAPTTVIFSGDSSVKLKVNNPNNFPIKDANVVLYDNADNAIGQVKFNMGPNETRDILVKFKLDSQEDTTGSIIVSANDNSNTYYIAYTKDSSFLKTGLFNLGMGGTISVVLGAIIIVLLVLYFALRKPAVSEVQ